MCKRTGHEAGFKGATYIDCPMKPCFLCKMPGNSLSFSVIFLFYLKLFSLISILSASEKRIAL